MNTVVFGKYEPTVLYDYGRAFLFFLDVYFIYSSVLYLDLYMITLL